MEDCPNYWGMLVLMLLGIAGAAAFSLWPGLSSSLGETRWTSQGGRLSGRFQLLSTPGHGIKPRQPTEALALFPGGIHPPFDHLPECSR